MAACGRPNYHLLATLLPPMGGFTAACGRSQCPLWAVPCRLWAVPCRLWAVPLPPVGGPIAAYVTQPRILRCMSYSPEFSDVCHTTQFSPMYVTQPRILRCMSHNPVFSDVCHSPEFFDVCLTTQFSPMYVTQPRILRCMSHNPVYCIPLAHKRQ